MKRTTIVDVGRHAGVSAKTVSRVFNDEPHVSEALKKRVRAAADALNYHPNVHAQALVRQRSHLIGLLYENPSPSYVVDLQMGVLKRLAGEPYRLVVIPIHSVQATAGEVVGMARSAALEGVVLAPPASDDPTVLARLAAAGIRCARIAPVRALDEGPVTLMDDVAAARDAAAHLLELGHRNIAVIKGHPAHPSADARLLGTMEAFAAAGTTLRADWLEGGLYTFDSGFEAAHRLLARPDRPSAILAQNDDMAVGAMMAARELRLSIPEDLSIVGFDDTDIARIAWPRLTTIRQPIFEMAESAADMLLASLEKREAPQQVTHMHELVVRGSTARPSAAVPLARRAARA